ncbi:hypothetical protein VTL71DRAFT_8360 [Oculimacula yallundae]|uniref:Uncharacterized protein n=1 Tax=Oculimacula yallundae TaxID=86028 RepID=A0ABR4CYD9_9HELO
MLFKIKARRSQYPSRERPLQSEAILDIHLNPRLGTSQAEADQPLHAKPPINPEKHLDHQLHNPSSQIPNPPNAVQNTSLSHETKRPQI